MIDHTNADRILWLFVLICGAVGVLLMLAAKLRQDAEEARPPEPGRDDPW